MIGSVSGQDESCVLFGYPSRQDGPLFPVQDCPHCFHKANFFGVMYMFWPCSKSFIDQACLVKMAGYWPCSF